MFSLSPQRARVFLKELVALQQNWAAGMAAEMEIYPEEVREVLQRGSSLKSYLSLPDKETFCRILREVAGVVGDHQPKFLQELEFIKNQGGLLYDFLGTSSPEAIEDLLAWAGENQIPAHLLGPLLDWVLRPVKMTWGRAVQPIIAGEGWPGPACPVCGEPADLALLGKEKGERALGCSCCQVTWPYPRLQCPGCGGTRPEDLQYYYLEDAPGQQIHYCQQCGAYIKTIDRRHAGEVGEDLLEISLLTAHLDLLAQEKGLHQLEGGGQR